jgi:hypothetical protein
MRAFACFWPDEFSHWLHPKQIRREEEREVVGTMKIVRCAKGGRIPEGYCRQSCLNYSEARKKGLSALLRRLGRLFADKGKAGLDIDKEEIAPLRKAVWQNR